MDLSSSDTVITSSDWSESAGNDVGTAGDVNSDGYDDIIVGVPLSDASAVEAGAAYLFLGSATGITASTFTVADAEITGENKEDAAGACTRTAGDYNDDGFDDLLISAIGYDGAGLTNSGAVYIVLGSSSGISDMSLSKADGRISGANSSTFFGTALSPAGDVNGDGKADFLVGAVEVNRAYLFLAP